MKKKRIALVEIGGSHDECLLSQMHAIWSQGHEVILITSPEVMDRNPAFAEYTEETFVVNIIELSRKVQVRKVWKILSATNVDTVVFNTAQGKVIRDLCFRAYFSSMEFVGIIHTTRMFTESFTQKIIHRKIKKYLLLSDYLKEKVSPQKGLVIDYFYPLRFPKAEQKVERSNKQIAIIGGVEERRKDLKGFLQMVQSLQDTKVRFVFLGKSDPSKPEVQPFLDAIAAAGMEDRIQTYDHFVSQEEFDKVVRCSDLILPLVHPNTPSADQYFRNQISGAMTVSFGYKVPLMIHEEYKHIEEMQTASFYYTQETFAQNLSEALAQVEQKSKTMKEHLAYSVEEQEQKYLQFLFTES
ncbi:MAG: hypothetical protein NXI10_03390 [bacterium]|nr:hypothetical protein [bacterium]